MVHINRLAYLMIVNQIYSLGNAMINIKILFMIY